MSRCLVGLALMLFALTGEAGVLRCSFTEPFFELRYDSASGRVVRISPDRVDDKGDPVPEVITENAKLERTPDTSGSLRFSLMNGPQTLLRLTLDGNGGDGMSERRFPFRAEYDHQEGACDTSKYPRWDFDDLIENLRKRR